MWFRDPRNQKIWPLRAGTNYAVTAMSMYARGGPEGPRAGPQRFRRNRRRQAVLGFVLENMSVIGRTHSLVYDAGRRRSGRSRRSTAPNWRPSSVSEKPGGKIPVTDTLLAGRYRVGRAWYSGGPAAQIVSEVLAPHRPG